MKTYKTKDVVLESRSLLFGSLKVVVLFVAAGFAWLPLSAFAANADISRSFKASEPLAEGAIVSANTSKPGYVVLANETEGQPLGVVTTATNSLIAINQQSDSVQVAVGGRAVVLVSTLNGDIHSGDLIAPSLINGVGVRATKQSSKVIGVAQQDFNVKSNGVKTQSVRLADNSSTNVAIGSVPMVIAIGASVGTTDAQSGLTGWASSLMGHQVSMWQLVLAVAIALVGFMALVVLVYGAITSGISAVGRNPLAKPTIFEALSQVMAMVSLIALSSVSLMYLVLRL